MADVLEQLRALYARAMHEATPEEEARTAAYVLLKTAKKHGVTVSFRKQGPAAPAESATSPSPEPYEYPSAWGALCSRCRQRPARFGRTICSLCSMREVFENANVHAATYDTRPPPGWGSPPRPEPAKPPPQCKRCRAPLESDRFEYCATCLEAAWAKERERDPEAARRQEEELRWVMEGLRSGVFDPDFFNVNRKAR